MRDTARTGPAEAAGSRPAPSGNKRKEPAADSVWRAAANVTLALGIAAFVAALAVPYFAQDGATAAAQELPFSPASLAVAGSILFFSFAAWASMKILANLSVRMREIDRRKP